MFAATFWYHATMGTVLIGGLVPIAFRPSRWLYWIVSIGFLFTMVFGAYKLGEDQFGQVRLLSYGLFIHLPAFLFLSWCFMIRRYGKKVRHLILAFLIVSLIGLDAFFIEPYWLQVEQVDIQSEKVSEPIKIALLSDLQAFRVDAYQKRVIETTCEQKPDLILLSGDYIQAGTAKRFRREAKQMQKLFQKMPCKPKYGILAIAGNLEGNGWKTMFSGLPVKTIRTSQTDRHRIGPLDVTTLSWRSSRNLNLAVRGSKRFHIVLGHAPDYALGKISADLMLAGHTHGGQVQIPFFGPIATSSKVPRQWGSGTTLFPDGKRLIVSNGIGMERDYAPRLRFWCRPQIVMINLEPTETKKEKPLNLGGSSPVS